MQVLISSIGTRGEVQPILALALALRELGHAAVLCVAPNFKTWVESFGVACIPVGPDLQKFVARSASGDYQKPTRAQWREITAHTVREQFQVMGRAAQGCHLMVVAGGLQSAGRSIAEALKIPYVYVAYCPVTLPSHAHPPPMIRSQAWPGVVNRWLWARSERSWNDLFRGVVNEQRAALGLAPVDSVPQHIFTQSPWLASDAALGPVASSADLAITQTGAWLLRDPVPLPDALEEFLARGEPPLYFGFGSMRATPQTSRVLIEVARMLGRRAVISQGWGNLQVLDAGADCISIGEVDHASLFPRVAAVIHHGGAGTTTVAAAAGSPQLIVPHLYDQHYWANRVQRLGIGVAGPLATRLEVGALLGALRSCLRSGVVARARAFAAHIELRGAPLAAARLDRQFG